LWLRQATAMNGRARAKGTGLAVLAAIATLAAPAAAPDAAASEASPTAAVAVRVEGRVVRVSGDVLDLVTRDGTVVSVQLSQVPGDLRAVLFPGRDVEVFAVPLPKGALLARGLTLDYGDAVSASPR
jgi:hypothetical protein